MQQKIFPSFSSPKSRYLLLLSVAVFLFLVGFYGRNAGYYTTSQIHLFLIINKFLCVSRECWLDITALGDIAVLLPLLSLAILCNVRIWSALVGSIPLSLLLTHGGKLFFSIPRPAAVIINSHFNIAGDTLTGHSSLPSGHSLTIFVVITILLRVLVFEKKVEHPVLWTILLTLFASLVAMSRVAVGAHWPMDVLAGAMLGVISGISGIYLTDRYTSWWRWMTNIKYAHFHIIALLPFLYAMVIREHFIAMYWLSAIVGVFVIENLIIERFTIVSQPARV